MIDATVGVTAQDQRLAERVDAAGCPVVVLLNKWELLDAEQRADVNAQVAAEAPLHRRGAGAHASRRSPARACTGCCPALAEHDRGLPPAGADPEGQRGRSAPAQSRQPAPDGARVLYATQGAADPPTFTLFTNRELPRTYLRYLENQLREAFDLGAVPVKLRVRRRTS